METAPKRYYAPHNRAHLIGETVDSIRNRLYKLGLLIMDDGSDDNTERL
jgi:glycosyltransferase involved in cell wall biosynthesis